MTPDEIARLEELMLGGPGPAPPNPDELPSKPAIVVPAESPPLAPPPAPAERKRARLYSPTRRGFMRATREEGIAAELEAMNAEARGTPFFDETQRGAPAKKER